MKPKKITVTLSEKANDYFIDLMYSLPHNADGSGSATHADCINYCLESMSDFEDYDEQGVVGYLGEMGFYKTGPEHRKERVSFLDRIRGVGSGLTEFQVKFYNNKEILSVWAANFSTAGLIASAYQIHAKCPGWGIEHITSTKTGNKVPFEL